MSRKLPLDELEIAIQLIQLDKPYLKDVSYEDLRMALEKEFNVVVDIDDVRLLYEPTIQQMEEDIEIHYGSMFNITRNEQYY